ncbi:MAG: hypothetical protein ACRETN_07625 [Nevskiales bacterium]
MIRLLALCWVLWFVVACWRGLALRLAFAGPSSNHPGLVALVWFVGRSARSGGIGGRHCWLWLPVRISRWLWLERACGAGWFGAWLRRQSARAVAGE